MLGRISHFADVRLHHFVRCNINTAPHHRHVVTVNDVSETSHFLVSTFPAPMGELSFETARFLAFEVTDWRLYPGGKFTLPPSRDVSKGFSGSKQTAKT